MQPSMFNVRVPLEDQDEVFLMNTFTDAQLIVSRDVAALLDRVEASVHRAGPATSRRRWRTLAEHGFLVESREMDRENLREFFHERAREPGAAPDHRAHHAAVQLRLRLLHPGGPRRLQQARREDVARDRGAGRATGPSSGSTRSSRKASC